MRYGLQSHVIPNNKEYGLNLTEKLLPQYLQELGYATHAIGVSGDDFLLVASAHVNWRNALQKWHLGLYRWEYTPTFRYSRILV